MDPTLLRLLQSSGGIPQQQGGQEGGMQPMMGQPMQAPMAPQTATVTNPFDAGIKSAIESARESLGATKLQKERMLQNSILTFGNEMGKLPRGRGFLENFANVGKAATPAFLGYNQEEEHAEALNHKLGQELLDRQLQQEMLGKQEEERNWAHQHHEAQLAEQRRYHDMMDAFKHEKMGGTGNTTAKLSVKERDQLKNQERLDHTFENAREKITKLGKEAKIGPLKAFARKRVGEEIVTLNPAQAQIDTIDKALRGQLFKAFGYRAAAEFKQVPSISASNPWKTNLAIIDQLRQIASDLQAEQDLGSQDQVPAMEGYGVNNQIIQMRTPDGEIIPVPVSDEQAIEDAIREGLLPVEE